LILPYYSEIVSIAVVSIVCVYSPTFTFSYRKVYISLSLGVLLSYVLMHGFVGFISNLTSSLKVTSELGLTCDIRL